MRLVTLEQVDPTAVCTDGSSAGYYWEPSTGDTGSHLWIMYLQGGDWCYSRESCEKRCGVAPGAGDLCSSRGWARSYEHFGYPCGGRSSKKRLCGIFSPSGDDDGALQAANKVFVRYCTSDAHMGNATAFGFQFRGAHVVKAVLTDLVGRGLGQRERMDTLLFGGGSAGARGAMIHLDYVQGMLGDAAQKVEVVGLLDSPLWMEMPEFRKAGAETTLPEQTQFVYRFANVGNLDGNCIAKYGVPKGWKCMFAEYRMPFVKTKYLLVAAQGDKFQLDNLLQHRPSSPDEFTYAERFAAQTKKVLQALSSEKHAILSWSCYNHMCSMSDDFDKASATTSAGNVSIAGALQQFLLVSLPGDSSDDGSSDDGRSSKPLIWMDDCLGFACGGGCPPTAGRLPSDVLPKLPEPPAETPRPRRKTHPFLAVVLLLLCSAGIAAACWNHRLLTKLGGSFAGVARTRHLEESYAALSPVTSPSAPAPRSPAPMWAHTPLAKKPGAFPSLGHMVWTEDHFEDETCDSPTDTRENVSPTSAPASVASGGLQYLGLFCGCNNHRAASAEETKRQGFMETFTAMASLLSCSRPKPQALYSL